MGHRLNRWVYTGLIPLLLGASCTSGSPEVDEDGTSTGTSDPVIESPERAAEWDDLCGTLGLTVVERDFGVNSYAVDESEEFDDALGCGLSISQDGRNSLQFNIFLETFTTAEEAVDEFHSMTDPEYEGLDGEGGQSYRMGLPHENIVDEYFDDPWHLGMIRAGTDSTEYDEVHGVGQYDAIVLGTVTRFYSSSDNVCEHGLEEPGAADCAISAEHFQTWMSEVYMPEVLPLILARYDGSD
ncbi:hypothetical protein [Glycomyces tenuis]|uniref:hypothetical protein n=1 Tax=Glycomyces tenuis TaxID=58116 RepID=UPI000478FE1C|nr:hypothetical protein [Glycomyces tenuis]